MDYFSSIIGHRFQIEQLRNLIKKDLLPHAVLFSGPPSIGKKQVALVLSWILLNPDNDPKLDRLLKAGNHPDLHFAQVAEGKKDIAVDDIRALISALQLKPYYSRRSVAIINDAHRMNLASSNALLKTLEEPNQNTHLILVTEAPSRLPETIISRCQELCFGYLSKEEIEKIIDLLLEDTATDKTIRDKLLTLCDGNLSLLNLGNLTNLRTGKIDDRKELELSLLNLLRNFEEFIKGIDRIIAKPDKANLSEALSFVAELGAEKQDKNKSLLFWHLLKLRIRKELVSASSNKTEFWASFLEEVINSERLTNERNASFSLQLSSILAKSLS